MRLTMPWTDVRGALGKEVDQLALFGAQAATVARSGSANTGAVVQKLVDSAAIVAPQVAALGRQRVRDLGHDVQLLGHDLRQIRLTTAPRAVPTTRPAIAVLAGVGVGLGAGIGVGLTLMYLLDPEKGKQRRVQLRERVTGWARRRRTVAAETADFQSRTVGVMAERRTEVPTPEMAEEATREGLRVPVG